MASGKQIKSPSTAKKLIPYFLSINNILDFYTTKNIDESIHLLLDFNIDEYHLKCVITNKKKTCFASLRETNISYHKGYTFYSSIKNPNLYHSIRKIREDIWNYVNELKKVRNLTRE